jgi:hypothetical protein
MRKAALIGIVGALLTCWWAAGAHAASDDGFFHRLQGASDVDKTLPNDGQVLVWDSGLLLWVPSDQSGGDSISVDAVAVVDPNFASTGDIDFVDTANTITANVNANAVALSTDTTGNYVATIADSGASEITVANSGTENAAVTLALASGITRDTELSSYVPYTGASSDVNLGSHTLTTTGTMSSRTQYLTGTVSGSVSISAASSSASGVYKFLNYGTVPSPAYVVSRDSVDTLTGKTMAAADNVIHADDAVNVVDADYGDVTVAAGVWAVEDNSHSHTAPTWENIGDAGGVGTIDFAGFDQNITSSEDGGNILTITNTDPDRAANTVILSLEDYDGGDGNVSYLQARSDVDGVAHTDFYLNQIGGGVEIGLIALDYASSFIESENTAGFSYLGFYTNGDDWELGAGGSASSTANLFYFKNITNNEDITIDSSANAFTVASTSGVTSITFSAIDLIVPTEAYDATGWNSDTSVPQKDAVRDKIEAMPQTAGRSLTLTGVDVLADAELYTQTICYRLPASPVATDDDKSIWINDTANTFTVTKLWAESDQTVTLMLQVDDGTPSDMDTVDLVAITTPDTDTSLDGDATIAAGDRVDVDVASVSGTPTWCTICFTGTWDD